MDRVRALLEASTPLETAHHEAGHHVAAMHLLPASPRGGLSLHREDPSAGVTFIDVRPNRFEIRERALVLLAGSRAEARSNPTPACGLRAFLGGHRDHVQVDTMLTAVTDSLDDRQAVRNQLDAEANAFVAAHWAEIQALAHALVARGALGGAEADAIAAGALRG